MIVIISTANLFKCYYVTKMQWIAVIIPSATETHFSFSSLPPYLSKETSLKSDVTTFKPHKPKPPFLNKKSFKCLHMCNIFPRMIKGSLHKYVTKFSFYINYNLSNQLFNSKP